MHDQHHAILTDTELAKQLNEDVVQREIEVRTLEEQNDKLRQELAVFKRNLTGS